MRKSGLVGLVFGLYCTVAAGQVRPPEIPPAARQTPKTDFGSVVKTGAVLAGTTEIEQQLEIEAAKSTRAAQTFRAAVSQADGRQLQSACASLVANPGDATASGALRQVMARYPNHDAEAIMRFCLDPTIAELRGDLRASREALERLNTSGSDTPANIDLQNRLKKQQQTFSSISSVMKTKHDTAKNSISNVR